MKPKENRSIGVPYTGLSSTNASGGIKYRVPEVLGSLVFAYLEYSSYMSIETT